MKKECALIATRLLALDNGLAYGVCALDYKNKTHGVEAAQATVRRAKELLDTKALTPEEAEPFLRAAQDGSSVDLMLIMSELHEKAEGLLLEKIIACECGKGA